MPRCRGGGRVCRPAPCQPRHRVPVVQSRKVHESMTHRNVGDVNRPGLLGTRDFHVPLQVWHHLPAVRLPRQPQLRAGCMGPISYMLRRTLPLPILWPACLGRELICFDPLVGLSVWIRPVSSLVPGSLTDGCCSLWYVAERDTPSSEATHLTDSP